MAENTIVLPPNPGGNGADTAYRLTVMVPKRRYLSYLRNRWWVIVVCMALAVGAVVIYETVRQETYSSYATLYITLGPQLGAGVFAEPKDDFATQIELLKGSKLYRDVMSSLPPETVSRLTGPVKVEVIRPMGTSILHLQASSSDPNVSQAFLEKLISAFLDFKKKTRLDTTEDVVNLLQNALDDREVTLKTNQEKWAEFERTNKVTLAEEDAKISSARLASLKAKLQELILDRQLIEKGLAPESASVSTNQLATIPGTNDSPIVTNGGAGGTNSLMARLMSKDERLRDARTQLEILKERRDFTATNKTEAAARSLDDQVKQLELDVAVLAREADLQREQSLRELDDRITATQQSVPIVESNLLTANNVLSAAHLINEEVQRQATLCDNLTAMLRNVDLTKNMAQERITPLDAPSQGRPDVRSLPVRISFAAVAGLFLALGIVFLWHLIDDRLVSIHDLKDQFGEALLGLVPFVKVPKSRPQAGLLVANDSRAGYVESYRHLRSALLLSTLGECRPQTLLFTGALPGEGKTTIAINLARMLAQSGKRVVLVDADLRGGRIHQLIGRDAGPGFLDFLRGRNEAKSIIYPTDLPGLSFVPSGEHNGETDKLLSHSNLGELMKELKSDRDFVIVDGAPVLASDDASLLVPYTDAVVMVMRPFFTRARQARRALEMLYQRRAKHVALIFNRARQEDLAGEYYARNGASRAAKNGKA